MEDEMICSEHYNAWENFRKVKMNKICPLGTDVGGFLWQCPECKTIVADWKETK